MVIALGPKQRHRERGPTNDAYLHCPFLERHRVIVGLRNGRKGDGSQDKKREDHPKNQHASDKIIRLEYARPFTGGARMAKKRRKMAKKTAKSRKSTSRKTSRKKTAKRSAKRTAKRPAKRTAKRTARRASPRRSAPRRSVRRAPAAVPAVSPMDTNPEQTLPLDDVQLPT